MLKNISMPVIALALGHLVTDLQAGALPIVLPHLRELFALSYSQLAFIVLTQNVTSSVIQPLFGYITDKKSLPAMLPFCAAMAGAGFAFVGWVPAYVLLMCTVVVIGMASATYHPQASKTVNFLSSDNNKAANMGIFSLGGNAGMAVGSILISCSSMCLRKRLPKKVVRCKKFLTAVLLWFCFLFLCAQPFIRAFPHICRCFLLISAMRSLLLQVC